MNKVFKRIKEGVEWVVFAKWYDGGDMGDGILVSLVSGAIFIYGGIGLAIYFIYKLFESSL